jgi:hypothetical protein
MKDYVLVPIKKEVKLEDVGNHYDAKRAQTKLENQPASDSDDSLDLDLDFGLFTVDSH